MEIHDITPVLGLEAPDYADDPPFRRTELASITQGATCNLSLLNMTCHAGAHIDAPAHFIPGGRTLDAFPASSFILPAMVVGISHPKEIRVEDLRHLEPQSGMALLFKTANSARDLTTGRAFVRDWVYLTREAANWCVERKLKLVGIDALSIDPFHEPTHPAHHALLGAGILVLEGLSLKHVEPALHTLICLPLRIHGAEASPVRAVLVEYQSV